MKPLLLTVLGLSRGTVPLTSSLTARWSDRGEAARRLVPGMDILDTPTALLHVFYPNLIGITIILVRRR